MRITASCRQCGHILALVMAAYCQPAASETVGIYAGAMETRDAARDDSYALELEYTKPLAQHFDLSLFYLNEGHPENHHRDGIGAQAWLRTSPLGKRLTLAAGMGPYYYFDTTRQDQLQYANRHGFGLIYSLAAAVQMNQHWSLQLRFNRVATHAQFDSNTALLGIGYWPDNAHTHSAAPTEPGEITVMAGQTIVNSFNSERGDAAGIEYRKAFADHLEWSVGALKESDNQRLRRKGITAQAWLIQPVLKNRLNFGIGLGPYLVFDRWDADGQEDERLAGIASLSARYRITPDWHAQATWSRVFTDDDSDADVLLIGAGYRF